MRGVPRRDVGAAGEARPDPEEHGVVATLFHLFGEVLHFAARFDLHAERFDAGDFTVEDFARQTVLRNAVAHHAARLFGRLHDVHVVPHAGEVIGRGKPRGPRTDDEDALSGFLGGLFKGPALFERMVAQEAFDRVNADALVEFPSVAGRFAGVVADAAHAGGEGIVLRDLFPGPAVVAAFGVEKPRLALFARGTLGVAGRQTVHVDGLDRTPRSGAVRQGRTDVQSNSKRFGHDVTSL